VGVSGGNYDLTGTVAEGSVQRAGTELRFEVADRDDASATIPGHYAGTVPDPFREGREVIVSGTVTDGIFEAEKDSLITKCPSKFADEAAEDPEHVVIE
jgi:cytochrome c-type biogenesis protein CcmE